MASANFPARLLSALAVSGLSLSIAACGINVKEKDNGKGDKDVTIQSPVANLHVGKDVKGADTGIAVYPGAKLIEKDDDLFRLVLDLGVGHSFRCLLFQHPWLLGAARTIRGFVRGNELDGDGLRSGLKLAGTHKTQKGELKITDIEVVAE